MKRKGIAQATLNIQQQGYYEKDGIRIDISEAQQAAQLGSRLITPAAGREIVSRIQPPKTQTKPAYKVVNQSTVQAIADLGAGGIVPGVLNFASAKNPGGGFLNGAMAQEEALAASSGLYHTLLLHETYYQVNRGCGTMMYTDHAIYSPAVPFFRDGAFELLTEPVKASVLTLPAVNMSQVLLKGEDQAMAKRVMKDRMRLCLALFADAGDRCLILGAYGCGVFRNDAREVAAWWQELLEDEGYGTFFTEIVFAVLDRSGKNIEAFQSRFGG